MAEEHRYRGWFSSLLSVASKEARLLNNKEQARYYDHLRSGQSTSKRKELSNEKSKNN